MSQGIGLLEFQYGNINNTGALATESWRCS